MKKIMILLVFTLLACRLRAQVLQPVHWSYAAKKTGKNEALILLKATIDEGWHIYAADQLPGGPAKTSFNFTAAAEFSLAGKIKQPTPLTKYEKAFELQVRYFEKSVIFEQKISLRQTGGKPVVVKGKLNYMVCNDHQCLPPEEVTFTIPVN
ncbi:protein-disulfide reductase DsbD domain-containing protein [Mucilaginibacter sp. UR6-11]|uniref:protein-disulfide reductase DsbD domain-containing protein n=1 Tax=Mucilaginibacter sp. UR6-11 TaxID=1435644 RepID=UPI001E4AAFA9|nr:protein-disulfide reductase DsbD domain-containing protein [Mucilaginibacter sp. UR6-11]MCC8426473.1 protein-disulfide reductase DsbD N-terminal domain-containing protein [Mucilaginibacter sp. UR6-11]